MFEESLVESTGLIRNRNRWPTVISIATQATLAAVLISIPMLHPEILSLHAPSLAFIAPPPRPAPPPPPPTRVVVTTSTTSSAPSAPAAPPMSNQRLIPTIDTAGDAPNLHPTTLNMNPGSTGNPFGSTVPYTGTSISVAPTTTAKPGKPLSVSSGVTTGHLIAPIQPVYPRIAIAARMEGTVIVQAIISKTGQIESAHVLTGPAMLQSAALEAVRTARYHPFLLNGAPTEVETTISINFRLGGSS